MATLIDKAKLRAKRERELAKRIRALPEKRYGVIVADPPWRFEPYSRKTGMDRAADNHYPTQTMGDIVRLGVPSISAKHCVLYLWSTVPMLQHALLTMSTWGFTYKSHHAWVKDKIGTGYWCRSQHELLLIGTKGHPIAPAPGMQWPSVIFAKRRKHSQKPDDVLMMIETLFPRTPKIELYRRGSARPGWDAWGNEAR